MGSKVNLWKAVKVIKNLNSDNNVPNLNTVKGHESMSCETLGSIVSLFLKFTNVKMKGQINN